MEQQHEEQVLSTEQEAPNLEGMDGDNISIPDFESLEKKMDEALAEFNNRLKDSDFLWYEGNEPSAEEQPTAFEQPSIENEVENMSDTVANEKHEEQPALPNNRHDCWLPEEDELVVKTVLEHIENGKTQLQAFEECSNQLNRTPAAVGFRWNATLRQRYRAEIEEAKKKRVTKLQQARKEKSKKHINITVIEGNYNDKDPFDITPEKFAELEMQHVQLKEKYRKLKREHEELKSELQKLKEKEKFLTEDYQNFIKILENARRLMRRDEYKEDKSTVFKMDINGNLERYV